MNFVVLIIVGFIFVVALVFVIIFLVPRVVRSEMKLSQDQFLQLAEKQFLAEQNKATTELETRKQAVQDSVASLKEQLEKYQKLLHDFEQDRATKYGNLENELKNASLATSKLQETTTHLNNILGNVKLRGQWGERMAEDIIQYAGLIEGVNYRKQKKLSTGTTKPDYTFLLPDDHTINMDVKFPLDNYIQMTNAQDEMQRDMYAKEFFKNVKDRIKEIQGRDYINPAENTLDFVLLFIPNEQVYGMIQEKTPDMLDMALSQKVVLCSPFTLYAMLSVIRQAHENFRYEKDIKKIILLIDQFARIYDKFKGRFDDIGKLIDGLDKKYCEVRDKSFKNLDTKIRHIDDYKKGKKISIKEDRGLIELSAEEIEDAESV